MTPGQAPVRMEDITIGTLWWALALGIPLHAELWDKIEPIEDET